MPSEEYPVETYGLSEAAFPRLWTESSISFQARFIKLLHACAGVYM
jgi:hypothetical protein